MSAWSALLSAACVILFFIIRGKQTARIQLERGRQMVTPETLARLLKKTGRASDLTLGPLPLLKDKETSHLLVTGPRAPAKRIVSTP